MEQTVVEARNLAKKYGDFYAAKDVNFRIREGEIFGLLGPNGAGKSTTISMLTCLLPPTSGSAKIFGKDVVEEDREVKKMIGVVPQEIALYPTLSGRANLRFFGELFGLRGKELHQRVENVLEYVAMSERADDAVRTYSGGMKRRINLAAGLIHGPQVLFLDEPTVGVDPQSRNHIFESVESLNRQQGMAILYTTHYMEEAERLCDRIAIIDQGEIIAMDTPKNLIALLGGGIIKVGLPRIDEDCRQEVIHLPAVKSAGFMTANGREDVGDKSILKVESRQVNEAMVQIIGLFSRLNVEILSLESLEPNLESVFLHLTGKSLRQ